VKDDCIKLWPNSSTFYKQLLHQYSFTKKFQSQTVIREKGKLKMLMKLTPGVNFVNFLLAAFMHADPKFAKKTGNMSVFFVLLGSSCIKSDHRMLVKLTPD